MHKSTATCLICNTEWQIHEQRENKNLFCASCRRSERQIDYGFADPCIPWRGLFDMDDNPIMSGKLHMPGERICNHKDCVQPKHLAKTKTWQDVEAERLGAASWAELMDTLKKEMPQMSEGVAKLQKTA